MAGLKVVGVEDGAVDVGGERIDLNPVAGFFADGGGGGLVVA